MAKAAARYVCQSCGASYPRWSGRCDNCGEWNTIVEETGQESAPKGLTGKRGRNIDLQPLSGEAPPELRRASAIAEFDRVVGGGLVKGSALLIGGDPGIGKSTLVLQVAAALGRGGAAGGTIYISGEESIEQVRLRARRMGLDRAPVSLAAATSLRDIVATLDAGSPPELVIVDSIQTMYVDNLDSAPGTVAQVRASAAELIRLAKGRGFSLLLVGHVTKEGMIAGPRVLEHMVDTVLYFEGERTHQFRILRAVKNRFGPANEIGVFEMTDGGLVEVANPSALFLSDHHSEVSGAVVFAGIEGSRPMLVEIQALLAPSPPGTPRRAVVGWDQARLAMVLAVLEARCGLALGGYDVYLNVAGGLRIGEPAADLAVAAALVSSRLDKPVPAGMVVFGEIGLGGEVRAVGQVEQRLREAEKLGFTDALIPPLGNRRKAPASGLKLHPIDHLSRLVERFARSPKSPAPKSQAQED